MAGRTRVGRRTAAVLGGVAAIAVVAAAVAYHATRPWRPDIPRVWDDAALEGWATPLAGLGQAPTHLSPAEYYAIPEEDLRSYPLYMPEREPAGYWEHLQSVGPQPLIEPDALATESDWIAAVRLAGRPRRHPPRRTRRRSDPKPPGCAGSLASSCLAAA